MRNSQRLAAWHSPANRCCSCGRALNGQIEGEGISLAPGESMFQITTIRSATAYRTELDEEDTGMCFDFQWLALRWGAACSLWGSMEMLCAAVMFLRDSSHRPPLFPHLVLSGLLLQCLLSHNDDPPPYLPGKHGLAPKSTASQERRFDGHAVWNRL